MTSARGLLIEMTMASPVRTRRTTTRTPATTIA